MRSFLNNVEKYNIDKIDFAKLWNGPSVALPQMLDAREMRVLRQQDLLSRFQKPLMCFTMNIAGPVKYNELISRGFDIGVRDFRAQCNRIKADILFEAALKEDTGCEAYFVVDADPITLKQLACELDDRDSLGRLYDMDVICPTPDGSGRKVERQEIGLPGRRCLICGGPTKECASRRLHSVEELQHKSAELLYEGVLSGEASTIAELSIRALLYEVSTTPKPGLVDRNNSGSHKDMDFFTFLNSSAALFPYFETCAYIGQETAFLAPSETFQALRLPGKHAEDRMLRATGNVNTHKGAIFSLGIVAAAAGRLSVRTLISDASASDTSKRKSPVAILAECKAMTEGLTAHDFAGITKENAKTVGQQLYAEYGITGVRGQMEEGLPAVSEYGLPLLKKLLAEGKSKDEAGAAVLMSIIAHTTDTNLIHRSSVAGQQEAAAHARVLMEGSSDHCPAMSELQVLDQAYIAKNLSPGGSADLLAVCWFLYNMETEGI